MVYYFQSYGSTLRRINILPDQWFPGEGSLVQVLGTLLVRFERKIYEASAIASHCTTRHEAMRFHQHSFKLG
jgi:hypothetical protein